MTLRAGPKLFDNDRVEEERPVCALWEGTAAIAATEWPSGEGGYQYNHRGLRVERTSATGERTRYLYDLDGNVVLTTYADGSSEQQVWLGGKLVQRIVRNAAGVELARRYLLTDHLGTVVMVTDEAGKIVSEGNFTPFGQDAGPSGFEDLAMRYTGKDVDPDTGLYYFNARWYDATTGRFISEDPVLDGTLWYAYVANSPMTFVDPTGNTPVALLVPAAVEFFKWALAATTVVLATELAVAVSEATAVAPGVDEGVYPSPATLPIMVSIYAAILSSTTVTSDAVDTDTDTQLDTAYRYVSEGEAAVILETGFIPNTNQRGQPKLVFLTTNSYDTVEEAEELLQMGSKNPTGATAPPSYKVTADVSNTPYVYGGNVDGSPSATEIVTTQPVPVVSVEPLASTSGTGYVDWYLEMHDY